MKKYLFVSLAIVSFISLSPLYGTDSVKNIYNQMTKKAKVGIIKNFSLEKINNLPISGEESTKNKWWYPFTGKASEIQKVTLDVSLPTPDGKKVTRGKIIVNLTKINPLKKFEKKSKGDVVMGKVQGMLGAKKEGITWNPILSEARVDAAGDAGALVLVFKQQNINNSIEIHVDEIDFGSYKELRNTFGKYGIFEGKAILFKKK